ETWAGDAMAALDRSACIAPTNEADADVKVRGPGIAMRMPSRRVTMILPVTVARQPDTEESAP
ncbi:hypothetical protein, partial [Bradyrhizobium sp. ORS 375]|uniref:hypothetical protein n=1 Tax=Bradyrhizobium sp. (strain ORS 375) TaxID=566679 RepID=UPI00055633CC